MSKRKRAPKPPADDSTSADEPVKDDMVHVTPDLLAGSDMFATKRLDEPSTAEPTAEAEPVVDTTPAPPASDVEPPEAIATPAPETETAAEPIPAPPAEPPPTYIPVVPMTPYPPRPRRAGSSAALGIVLVVLGLFALVIALTGADLTENGWPLFILIPGLTLLIAGFLSFGSVATIPGGIVTMLGIVLAYTNSTEHWAVLAYAWSLVVPFGVGLGVYLQALRDRDQPGLRTGRTLLAVGFMIFLIGFVLFESILGISGRDTFGPVGKAALPVLLILVGVILFVRSWQRSRQV